MLNLRKPALIFAILGLILFFVGLYMLTMDPKTGYVIMFIGLGIGVIYYIWSVIDVLSTNDLKPFQKKFWLIIVLIIPAFGGLIYHMMHQRGKKIVT